MESISTQDALNATLKEQRSVVYFYVDWSVYAKQGLGVVEELESSVAYQTPAVTFRLADVSDVNAAGAFMFDWLKQNERADLKLCNRIALGNGSVMWLLQGQIVDFEPRITSYDLFALTERTKRAFGLGDT
jgi:hypothetical protein